MKKSKMKKCCSECEPVCDFCRFHNFNPDKHGAYTGKGYCVLHEKKMDPCSYCDDYLCIIYKVKESAADEHWKRWHRKNKYASKRFKEMKKNK